MFQDRLSSSQQWFRSVMSKVRWIIPPLISVMMILILGLILNLASSRFEAQAGVSHLVETGGGLQQPGAGEVNAVISQTVGNLDLVMVLDRTGSMRFDTICYGCWARCGDTYNSMGNNGNLITPSVCDASSKYLPFPNNGRAFPYDFDGTVMKLLRCGTDLDCSTPDEPLPIDIGGNPYIVMEAEFYTYNNAHDQFPAAWDPRVRTPGRGYWALQRNTQAKAYSIDGYGENYLGTGSNLLSGFVRHHPYIEKTDNGIDPYGRHYTLDDVLNNAQTPRLEYEFIPTWSGTTYIYMRVQWFDKDNTNTPTDPHNQFFWAVDNGTPAADTSAPSSARSTTSWWPNDNWGWIRLNAGVITPTNSLHTLNIWASSVGYAIDRIIVTNDAQVISSNKTNVLRAAATPGSAQGLASDPCNPIFGLTVLPSSCTSGFISLLEPVNNLNDPLFSGLQSGRGAVEAAKEIARLLDPQKDQVGLVTFSNNAEQQSQLECLRASSARANAGAQLNGYPPVPGTEYDETVCFDPDEAAPGTVPLSFTNVFIGAENAYPPDGNTDIADGLRRALHMLGINTDNDDGGNHANDCDWTKSGATWRIGGKTQPANNITSHCGRSSQATPVIVLLTDGAPTNSDPGDNNDCIGPIDPLPYPGFPNADKKYQCIMYYTQIAAANDVTVCPIGLGLGADPDLLQAMAALTYGHAYFAMNYTQLDMAAVLDDCLESRGADLVINKTRLGPNQVTAGGSITYTLVMTNIGPSQPVTATLVDTWTPPEAVSGVSAPGCAINLGGGVLTCTRSGLLAGAAGTGLTVVFTTGQTFSGVLTNAAVITSTDGFSDPLPFNNRTNPVTVSVVTPPTPPELTTGLDGVPGSNIPPGSNVEISLTHHPSPGPYYVCLDGADAIGPFNVDAGGQNVSDIVYQLAVAVTSGAHTFSSQLASDCSDPSLAETTITVVSESSPAVGLFTGGVSNQVWPVNSQVEVLVVNHLPNTTYQIYLNGQALLDNFGSVCLLTTDADGDIADNCVIPDNFAGGTYQLTSTLTITNPYAVNVTDQASLAVAGGTHWLEGSTISVSLLDHARHHQYYLYGYNGRLFPGSANPITTNGDGNALVSFTLPVSYGGAFLLQSQDAISPLPPSDLRRIASLSIDIIRLNEPEAQEIYLPIILKSPAQ